MAEPLRIDEFPVRPFPLSITPGPDGNLWFTESLAHNIGRITPTGTVTEFHVDVPEGAFGSLNSITAGPDGNLWFTDQFIDRIGRITPTGEQTFFPIPPHEVDPAIAPSGVQAGDITTGPDGNLWFTESAANQIVRMTTNGVFTEFPLPIDPLASPEDLPDIAFPAAITPGPDGNLWFTETRFGAPHVGNKIGRITTAGAITEFPIPTPDSFPGGITVGPDGNIWFTEQGADVFDDSFPPVDKIGRITLAGLITEFPAPAGSNPADITTGADGNLWFTERGLSRIARMTTAGEISEFATPTPASGPRAITAGPDGRVWFTEVSARKIGRTSVLGCTARLSGRIVGPLELNRGATCISNAQVVGPILVRPGASLFLENSEVVGDVSTEGAGVIRMCATKVESGGVTIRGTTDSVELGNPASGCAPDDISGTLTFVDNTAPTNVLSGTRIAGDLQCSGNAPAPADGGLPATVTGARGGQCAQAVGGTTSTTAPTTRTTTPTTTTAPATTSTTTTTAPLSDSRCGVLEQQRSTASDPAVREQLEAIERSLGCAPSG